MSSAESSPYPNTIPPGGPSPHQTPQAMARVRGRLLTERLFRWLCIGAIGFGLTFVGVLFASIFSKGHTAFQQTQIELAIHFDPAELGVPVNATPDELSSADYAALIRSSLAAEFPGVTDRRERRLLSSLVSGGGAFDLRAMLLEDPGLLGQRRSVWLPADDDVDMLRKGHIQREAPEAERRLKDTQVQWLDELERRGKIKQTFNSILFTAGDSREPELSGLGGAIAGSFYTLLVTLGLAFPLGIAAAVYLEEFARKNRFMDFLEVNINNLAAVPSIVFGLLGLAVFINFFDLPRSAPIVAGLVLSLMTLPVIIIASRAAIQSVPYSIREAGLGMGASKVQVVLHHVLPLAMPGMLTGAIIGMARALGETAPLLMIGMVAFVVAVPGGFFDPATALPVQVYLWADSPERAFAERTSAAILVLLAFLLLMNAAAVVLRRRFERRW